MMCGVPAVGGRERAKSDSSGANKLTNYKIGKQTDRQRDRHTGRETDIQAERHADIQAER